MTIAGSRVIVFFSETRPNQNAKRNLVKNRALT
jgi:hypothetical protein